jgi:hypothetical protein
MTRATDLRHRAFLYRRMANVPTFGGRHEDRLLLALAQRLEHEAAILEEPTSVDNPTEAGFAAELHDPDLRALYRYWDGLRLGRLMPRRSDLDPTEIPKLLPHTFMYNVLPTGNFTIRLSGEEVRRLSGQNTTGLPAGSTLTPRGAAMIVKILARVRKERAPKFRAGKAYWQPNYPYRNFEACFLPLSSDGDAVDVILGGLKFEQSLTSCLTSRTTSSAIV